MGMIPMRTLLLGLICLLPWSAAAQWQWIDKDGHKVYSDRAPPSDIPEKNIVRQPSGSKTASASSVSPANAGLPPTLAASAPELAASSDKKARGASDDAAKQKLQDCERARNSLSVMKSGIRLRVPNAKGDVEYMSDGERASETQRLQTFVDGNCK